MIRVFGHAKTKNNTQGYTEQHPQNTLLEQALQFEQQRTKDLQQQLNEAKQQIQFKETQISELLQTIKDLSQSVKRLEAPTPEATPRKKFWIF